jgi:hypothetical protein
MAEEANSTGAAQDPPFTISASFSYPYPNYGGPPPAAWNYLISVLRKTAELHKELSESRADHPVRASMLLVLALADYLRASPTIQAEPELGDPLARLGYAMAEVYAGRKPSLFKPNKSAGNPGKSLRDQEFMVTAALAVHYLMESGLSRQNAAKAVMRAVETADPGLPVPKVFSAETILRWRDGLTEGKRVPGGALKGFELEHAESSGVDPKKRAELFLQRIKHHPLLRF